MTSRRGSSGQPAVWPQSQLAPPPPPLRVRTECFPSTPAAACHPLMEDLHLLANPFSPREPRTQAIYWVLNQNTKTQGHSPAKGLGLILGPIRFLSAPAICDSRHACTLGSTIRGSPKSGIQGCSGTDGVLHSVLCSHSKARPGPLTSMALQPHPVQIPFQTGWGSLGGLTSKTCCSWLGCEICFPGSEIKSSS